MRYTMARAFGAAAGLVMGAAFGAAVVWSVSAAADVVVARFPDPLYRRGTRKASCDCDADMCPYRTAAGEG